MNIKKVIARRDFAREVVDSSQEEMTRFIIEGIRPEFNSDDVFCIKFLENDCDSLDEAEETSWFINPYIWEELQEISKEFRTNHRLFLEAKGLLTDVEFEEAKEKETDEAYNSYGPKMASEFLPEILSIRNIPIEEILSAYSTFYTSMLSNSPHNLSDEEKFDRFIEYLSEYCDN